MRYTFIFYRSFYEAAKTLDNSDRLTLYDAIAAYALDGIEPERSGVPGGMFLLMKPVIDANTQRYENGKKGGRPKNQTETETKPNQNQNVTKPKANKDKDKYKDKDVNVDKDKDSIHLTHDIDGIDYWDRVLSEETA